MKQESLTQEDAMTKEKERQIKQAITEQRWTRIAQAQFLNKRIVKVRYLSAQEATLMGWDERCIVLQLDDGNLLMPSSDDEGNGPGALFTQHDTEPTIPVIR